MQFGGVATVNRKTMKALGGRIGLVGCCECGEYRLPLRKIEGKYYCPKHVPRLGTKEEVEPNGKE